MLRLLPVVTVPKAQQLGCVIHHQLRRPQAAPVVATCGSSRAAGPAPQICSYVATWSEDGRSRRHQITHSLVVTPKCSHHCCRYDTRSDIRFEKDAPIIGLVLQRSHLVTGDEGHYSGVVANLEGRGAKVGLLGLGSRADISTCVQLQHPTFFREPHGPDGRESNKLTSMVSSA